jgi:hypothetical protein
MQFSQSVLIALAAIPAVQFALAAPVAAADSGVKSYGDYGNYGKVSCPSIARPTSSIGMMDRPSVSLLTLQPPVLTSNVSVMLTRDFFS